MSKETFIKRCIELSKKSLDNNDGPFGALITKNNDVIAESLNKASVQVNQHAEILVLNKAHDILRTTDLSECTLYSNCEPCPMCSFMIRELKIKKVVFGIFSKYMGGFSRWDILQDKHLVSIKPFFGEVPEIIGGVLQSEALKVFDELNIDFKKYFQIIMEI